MKSRFLIAIGILFAYLVYKFAVAASHSAGSSAVPVKEYVDLFRAENAGYVKPKLSYLSDVKKPVSLFDVGNDYELIVYKIDSANSRPLDEIVTERSGSDDDSGIVYSIIDGHGYELQYDEASQPANVLSITLDYEVGDLHAWRISDTSLFYTSNSRRLAITYNRKTTDMIITDRNLEAPVNLAFIKHNQDLYLIIMSPTNKKAILRNESLFELLK